jgi:hypothetical protein
VAIVVGILALITALSSVAVSPPTFSDEVRTVTGRAANTSHRPVVDQGTKTRPIPGRNSKARSNLVDEQVSARAGTKLSTTETAPSQHAAPLPDVQLRPPRHDTEVPRRLSWARVESAKAYAVRLYRGQRLVFAATTNEAAVDLPARWRLHGQTMKLTPGEYRWYVWPVTAAGRASVAIVQSKLVVPRA